MFDESITLFLVDGRGMNGCVWGDRVDVVVQGVLDCVVHRYFVRICLSGGLLVGMG